MEREKIEKLIAKWHEKAKRVTTTVSYSQALNDCVAELQPILTALLALGVELRGFSNNAYCDYIAQMKRDKCLGLEAKLKSGTFGKAELEAHTRAGELLGRHRAFAEALTKLERIVGKP
jgi:hypothetical protein